MTAPADIARVSLDVVDERIRQVLIWGEQNHPDGTGAASTVDWAPLAAMARAVCKRRAAARTVTWLDIAREEVFEAFAEDDPVRLRAELIQASAVFAAWAEAIDRRAAS